MDPLAVKEPLLEDKDDLDVLSFGGPAVDVPLTAQLKVEGEPRDENRHLGVAEARREEELILGVLFG